MKDEGIYDTDAKSQIEYELVPSILKLSKEWKPETTERSSNSLLRYIQLV